MFKKFRRFFASSLRIFYTRENKIDISLEHMNYYAGPWD